jgi:hypothetical protein
MINHKALRALYPTTFNILEHQNGTVEVYDAAGNQIQINLDTVQNWVDPEAYKTKRQAEYPSFADQLDTIFHDGLDAWKSQIQAVKDKYPKGNA